MELVLNLGWRALHHQHRVHPRSGRRNAPGKYCRDTRRSYPHRGNCLPEGRRRLREDISGRFARRRFIYPFTQAPAPRHSVNRCRWSEPANGRGLHSGWRFCARRWNGTSSQRCCCTKTGSSNSGAGAPISGVCPEGSLVQIESL